MSFSTILSECLIHVPIEAIAVNPFQPRKAFCDEELAELAESIRSVGLIHPPTVRPLDEGRYELISGERRYRASVLAGLKTLPVVVRQNGTEESAQAALIENIQRVDLNPIEIAKAFRSLIDEFRYSHEELARRVGKKRSTVANYLRLLTLPKTIQESVSNGSLSMGHAKAVLSLEGFDKQELLHDLILRDELSVREAEQAALRIESRVKKKELVMVTRDFFLEDIAEKLQHKLGTKVTIQGTGKKGRISIDYYNLDDLDRLIEQLVSLPIIP